MGSSHSAASSSSSLRSADCAALCDVLCVAAAPLEAMVAAGPALRVWPSLTTRRTADACALKPQLPLPLLSHGARGWLPAQQQHPHAQQGHTRSQPRPAPRTLHLEERAESKTGHPIAASPNLHSARPGRGVCIKRKAPSLFSCGAPLTTVARRAGASHAQCEAGCLAAIHSRRQGSVRASGCTAPPLLRARRPYRPRQLLLLLLA